MLEHRELERILDLLLNAKSIKDYAPNGLQVEGRKEIKKIITGVSASYPLIQKAIERNADAIIVHHGYFWKNEEITITGMKARRIKALLSAGINLYGYHLPLDMHPTLGNNARFAQLIGVSDIMPMEQGNGTLALWGRLDEPMQAVKLQEKIAKILNRQILLCDEFIDEFTHKEIKTLGICTGAGQDYIDVAARLGLDAFISGEISERTTHSAREQGIYYFAAGHHATERYGVKALGEYLSHTYDLEVEFIDIDNPA